MVGAGLKVWGRPAGQRGVIALLWGRPVGQGGNSVGVGVASGAGG